MKIYNTLTRKKEAFKPLKNKKVNMFVCGPTVYDFIHIGNARTCVVFDSFARYLRSKGYKVFYLQNITNIDDKIMLAAKEKGVLPLDLAATFEKEYIKDMKLLGVKGVNEYARATDYIKEIISQVSRLMEKGYAYALQDGIYFDIARFKPYGKLSGRTALEAEDAVSRIDYNKNKKNRGDFCLWKFKEEHNQEEPSWNSPFGKGRPGWHIEDTAITETFFGDQYDIHGGGVDLKFPHHEAEIAQMEAISGKKFLAKYWMHTGFLTIGGQKMSKSLNNFIILDGFLKRHSYRHLRFWFMKHAWRAPVDYSDAAMVEAKQATEKMEELLRKLQQVKNPSKVNPSTSFRARRADAVLKKARKEFYKHLDDDFNTPKAFAELFNLVGVLNGHVDKDHVTKNQAKNIIDFFKGVNEVFDIIDFGRTEKLEVPAEVAGLLKDREVARKSGEWEKADKIRKEIETYGYKVEDTKDGAILKK